MASLAAAEGLDIVRASGVCCHCDSRFRDEVVVRIADQAVPSGFVYIELRHLASARRDVLTVAGKAPIRWADHRGH
jgi:hypothetical protein